jgi:DNA-binding transcriptional LysR family regulator
MHDVMINWFGQAGTTPRRVHSCNSDNIVSSLVKNGIGISLMPSNLHKDALQSGALVKLPVTMAVPKFGYVAIYTQNAGLSTTPELSILPEIAEFAREESWFLRTSSDGSIPWSEA